MTITHDFFKHPEKYLAELDDASAQKLINQLSVEIPSCFEALRNLSQTHTSMDLLEKKVRELHGLKKDDSLLRAFGEWKQLTQETLLKDIFTHHHAYLKETDPTSVKMLLETLKNLEGLPEAQATLTFIRERLSLAPPHDPLILSATSQKCDRILTHYLPDSPTAISSLEEIAAAHSFMALDLLAKPQILSRIVQDIEEGELSKALWPVLQGQVSLEELESLVEKDVYEWMQLCYYFDPLSTDLETMALSQNEGVKGLGWGYKSANLTLLSNHANEVSLQCKSARIAVPSFLPISDFEMQRYVMHEYPEILEDWSRFVESFNAEDRASFTPGSLTLSEQSREILATIRKGIGNVFEKRGYDTPALRKWLETQRPEFVIVRSTGKEDSDTNSNAGGNASIPFIQPDPKSIAGAMSEVLISYFGEKSILQRLAAGDSSLFEKELFLPVLIQEMVGEPIKHSASSPEEIPRSGVIFTISAGDPTVSELSVGLGNNEGIVSSSVVTDHYLLDREGGVVKAVREKGTRFVAQMTETGNYACEAIENTDSILRKAPALSREIAQDIKCMADYFSQEVYGKETAKPLDMEFSVLTPKGCDQPIIYLLQARPLIILKKEQEPSYIDKGAIETTAEESKALGKTLIDGGSYVRSTLTSSMIICDTIKEALTLFLKSPPHARSQIKTVVISKTAPITSHEAVTLRARGIGIIVMEEKESFEKVKRLVKEHKPVVIDMQRGVIIEQPSYEVIKQGYTCYPIPLEYSITPSKELRMLSHLSQLDDSLKPKMSKFLTKHLSEFEQSVTNLIQTLKGAHEFEATSSGEEIKTWRRTLETIASGNADEMKLAAALLLDRLKKLTLSPGLKALPNTRLELLIVLEEVKKIIEGSLLQTADKAPLSLERLYPVRLLEACFFQSGDVLGGFSALRCLQAIHDQKEIALATGISIDDSLASERALSKAPLVRISRNFLQPRIQKLWEAIVQRSDTLAPDLLTSVNEGIMKLSRLEILTQWTNTSLLSLLQEKGLESSSDITSSKIEALFSVINQELKKADATINHALQAQEKLRILSLQMSAWSDPDHVRKQAKNLVESFQSEGFTLDPTLPHSLAEQYQSASALGKMVLLQSALEMVRLYDHLIKTVKASTEYKDSLQQACDFKRLLDQYYVMMDSVLAMAQRQGFFTQAPGIHNDIDESQLSIQNYLERIRYGYKQPLEDVLHQRTISPGFALIDPSRVDEDSAKEMMLPSSRFNVSTATVGSGSDYDFSMTWPVHLEDYFTLFHQNMESCINALKSTQDIALNTLPIQLQNMTGAILDKLYRSSITSITVEHGVIQVSFNVPLRQHAATLQLTYDLKKPETCSPVKLKMSIFGRDENSRWEMVSGAIALIGRDLPCLKAEKADLNLEEANGIIFELESLAQTAQQQQATINFLATLNSLTMSASSNASYLRAVKNLKAALGASDSLSLNREKIEHGGFHLALEIVQESLLDENLEQAERLLSFIEGLITENPSLANARNEMGFFVGDREKTLAQSFSALHKQLDTARREGLHQSVWQRFEREQNRGIKQRPQHLLQAATLDQRKDPSFVREAVLSDPDNILYADRSLKGSKVLMKELIQAHPKLYLYINLSLQADEELACLYARSPESKFEKIHPAAQAYATVITAALESNGLNLEKVAQSFKSQHSFVEKAVQSNGLALKFAGSFKSDPEIVEMAITQNGTALKYASAEVINERLTLKAIVSHKGAYAFASETLRATPEVAQECLLTDITLVRFLPEALKNNVAFILEILDKLDNDSAPIFFNALPTDIKNLPNVAQKAVSKQGLLLKELEPETITPDIAVEALTQNIAAHPFFPKELWDNEVAALAAVKGDGRLFFRCSTRLQSSKPLALAAISKAPSLLSSLPLWMQKDADILAAAWGNIRARS